MPEHLAAARLNSQNGSEGPLSPQPTPRIGRAAPHSDLSEPRAVQRRGRSSRTKFPTAERMQNPSAFCASGQTAENRRKPTRSSEATSPHPGPRSPYRLQPVPSPSTLTGAPQPGASPHSAGRSPGTAQPRTAAPHRRAPPTTTERGRSAARAARRPLAARRSGGRSRATGRYEGSAATRGAPERCGRGRAERRRLLL